MIAVITPSERIYEEVENLIGHFEDIQHASVQESNDHEMRLENGVKSTAERMFDVMASNEEPSTLQSGANSPGLDDLHVGRERTMQNGEVAEAVLAVESGLFVPDLDGFPGPETRYVAKTLGVENLWELFESHDVDRAAYRTAVSYVTEDVSVTFRGQTIGKVVPPRGDSNQGAEQLFEVEGETFAEMAVGRKNMISSRSRALTKFADWKSGNDLHGDSCLV